MEDNKIKMPCPACPEGCKHFSPTCRPVCKTWKTWQEEHKEPRPKITQADAYRNAKHKEACAKMEKRGRHW